MIKQQILLVDIEQNKTEGSHLVETYRSEFLRRGEIPKPQIRMKTMPTDKIFTLGTEKSYFQILPTDENPILLTRALNLPYQ